MSNVLGSRRARLQCTPAYWEKYSHVIASFNEDGFDLFAEMFNRDRLAFQGSVQTATFAPGLELPPVTQLRRPPTPPKDLLTL